MHASAPSHSSDDTYSDARCQRSLSAEVSPSQYSPSQNRCSLSGSSQLTCLGVSEHCSPKRSISETPSLNFNTDDGAVGSSVRFHDTNADACCRSSLSAEVISSQHAASENRCSLSESSQSTATGVTEHCSPKRSNSDCSPLNCNTDHGADGTSLRFYEMETSVEMSESLTAEAADRSSSAAC